MDAISQQLLLKVVVILLYCQIDSLFYKVLKVGTGYVTLLYVTVLYLTLLYVTLRFERFWPDGSIEQLEEELECKFVIYVLSHK